MTIYRKIMGGQMKAVDVDCGKFHSEVKRPRVCLICGRKIPATIANDGTFLWWSRHSE